MNNQDTNQELLQFWKDAFLAALRGGQNKDYAEYCADTALERLKNKMLEFKI